MKIYKRALVLLSGAMIVGTAAPVCASEASNTMKQTSAVVSVAKASSKDKATDAIVRPKIDHVSIKEIDGDNYFIIEVSDNTKSVKVDGKSAEKYKTGEFRYKITKDDVYTIIAYDKDGNASNKREVDGNVYKKLSVKLSKVTSGSKTYLRIKVTSGSDIKKVTVNDEKVTLKSDNTYDYRIEKSGKYTVEVTDKNGKTEEESLTIDMDDDAPTVKLSKRAISGKWYLIIEITPNDGNKIASVKVDNKSVSFDKKGGEIQYEAKKGVNTYKVVVKDSEGLETKKELKIDGSEAISAPVLKVVSSTIGTQTYLSITVSDDGKVKKLTVNGNAVSIGSNGGTVQYPVTVTGNYTVVAVDDDENETSQTIYATAMNAVPVPTYTSTHAIILKINSSIYSVDGVAQQMDSAVMAKNGRTYIPIRYLSNALGIPGSNIQWDKNTKTVIIKDGSHVVKVPLGQKTMTLDGQSIAIDSPVIQVNGRVMVPISQVSKAFTYKNVKINWDPNSKQAIITRN